MGRYDQVEAFILAGGASSRMGRDKALVEIGGALLLVRTARLLEPLAATVTVIGPPERYASLGLRVAPDDSTGLGPLAGMATALRISRSEWNLIVGCDLPYLRSEWLEWLIRRALVSSADALVPKTVRGLEPLCAIYRARCAPTLAAAIAAGVRKVTDALSELEIEELTPNHWQAVHPGNAILRNMNTPADYEEARARLEANGV
jgi:molybdopterin-guanine dinucleotide biosynthesis protein A